MIDLGNQPVHWTGRRDTGGAHRIVGMGESAVRQMIDDYKRLRSDLDVRGFPGMAPWLDDLIPTLEEKLANRKRKKVLLWVGTALSGLTASYLLTRAASL